MGCSSSRAHRYTSSMEEGELCAKRAQAECASAHRARASRTETDLMLASAVLLPKCPQCPQGPRQGNEGNGEDNYDNEEGLAVAQPVPPPVVDEACVRPFTSEEVLVLRDLPIGAVPGSVVSVRLCDGRRFFFSVPIGYVHGEGISIPLD